MFDEVKDATLYVVATPIGNLRDITLRALDVLKSVDVIVAEDTRVCNRLLAHFGFSARVIASHEHNERRSAAGIVKLLEEGKSIALTTDAGTPAISDPGSEVVALAREKGYAVVPVPGASALTAALSVAGERLGNVMFVGFLPAKDGERRKELAQLATVAATLVFYEAPHRVLKTLDDLALAFGADGHIVLCRELTKMHEEIQSCALGEARSWLESKPERIRGEFVLVVNQAKPAADEQQSEGERVLALLMGELPLKKAVSLAVEITGARRNALYQHALELSRKGGSE